MVIVSPKANEKLVSVEGGEILSAVSPIPEKIDVFISARFRNDIRERQARELDVELRKDSVQSYIVNSKAGDDFNDITVNAHYDCDAMVVFGCEQYGAKTKNCVSRVQMRSSGCGVKWIRSP